MLARVIAFPSMDTIISCPLRKVWAAKKFGLALYNMLDAVTHLRGIASQVLRNL